MAFQYPAGLAQTQWDAVPEDTDVLITHTPPATMCGSSLHWPQGGCSELTKALSRIRPVLHVCGHCHEGRGARVVRWSDETPGLVERATTWDDPGAGNKKMCLLDLTGKKGERVFERGSDTAVVNASIMMKSWDKGSRSFNKPIVVDVPFEAFREDE